MLVIFVIGILLFVYFLFNTLYQMVSFKYCKPKYRIDKNGYVEYFNSNHFKWETLYGWNTDDDERVCIIHGINRIPFEIKYKGPGRCRYRLPANLSKQELRNEVEKFANYKTAEECYEKQMELINNECIALAKRVKINYEVINE